MQKEQHPKFQQPHSRLKSSISILPLSLHSYYKSNKKGRELWPHLGKARRSSPRKTVWKAAGGESKEGIHEARQHSLKTYGKRGGGHKNWFFHRKVLIFLTRARCARFFLFVNLNFKNLELFYNGRLPDFKGCGCFFFFCRNAFLENQDFCPVAFL